jgi:hypothetical protein
VQLPQSKRRETLQPGETGLLNSLSGKASNVNIVSSSGDPVQVPMYKLEDKTPLREILNLVRS